MHQVFPYLEVFRVARSDLLILAGEQRPKLNLDRVSWALRTEPIRTDLASVDVHDPLHIAIHHLVASTELYRLTPFGPINLDDHPILEYRAPLELFGASDVDLSQWFYRCHSDQYLLKVYRAAIDPDVERWHSVLAYGRKELDPRIIRAELEAILDKSPAFLPALIDLANDALQNRDLHHAQTLIDRALVIDSASAAAQLLAFRVAVAIERDRQPLDGLRAFVESRRHLETLIYLEPEDLSHYLDLLPLALHAGDHSRVRSLIQEIHSRFGAGDLQAMTRVYLVTVQGALAFEEGNLAAGRQLLESASGQIDQMDAPMRKFYSQTWSDLTRSPASIAQP